MSRYSYWCLSGANHRILGWACRFTTPVNILVWHQKILMTMPVNTMIILRKLKIGVCGDTFCQWNSDCPVCSVLTPDDGVVYNLVNQIDVEKTEEEIIKFNQDFTEKIKREKEKAVRGSNQVLVQFNVCRCYNSNKSSTQGRRKQQRK